ncbi:histidinol-phosphate transaminase [Gynuella sp.]|uniref:histidinol-phosphate transaminase n=1 Tax=Gynuella sp. TaxID=2969146 RepID=UPI003D0F4EC1
MTKSIPELVNTGIHKLRAYEPGKSIDELGRELGVSPIVKMASNENPLGPSQKVRAAIESHLDNLCVYPDADCYHLKTLLSDKLQVNNNQLVIGNGSNEVLELIAKVFLRDSDEVIFSEHAFAMYSIFSEAMGATLVAVKDRNWCHDLDAMADAISEKTKIIFIANPNNPTGTWVSKGELKAFLKSVPEHVIVVLDEAYFEYVDQENYQSGLHYIDRFPNLVVTRTFSKVYGLANLRVGYAVASETIAGYMNRVRQPFNVSGISEIAAIAALGDQEYLLKSLETNALGMAQLQMGVEALNLDYIPSVANFLTVHVGDVAQDIYQALLRKGYIVRPLSGYGMSNYLRISVGTEAQNQGFLVALKEVLDSL